MSTNDLFWNKLFFLTYYKICSDSNYIVVDTQTCYISFSLIGEGLHLHSLIQSTGVLTIPWLRKRTTGRWSTARVRQRERHQMTCPRSQVSIIAVLSAAVSLLSVFRLVAFLQPFSTLSYHILHITWRTSFSKFTV